MRVVDIYVDLIISLCYLLVTILQTDTVHVNNVNISKLTTKMKVMVRLVVTFGGDRICLSIFFFGDCAVTKLIDMK